MRPSFVLGPCSGKVLIRRDTPQHRKGTYMRDIAKEVYEKMKVGAIAWIRPVAAKGDTIAAFQTVHDQVTEMAGEGLIAIATVQRQEDGMIDAIRIKRLS